MLTDGLIGFTVIEVSGESVTVTEVDPIAAPELAVTVALPALKALPTPAEVINSTAAFEELHVTALSTLVEPSSYLPTAVNV